MSSDARHTAEVMRMQIVATIERNRQIIRMLKLHNQALAASLPRVERRRREVVVYNPRSGHEEPVGSNRGGGHGK